MATHVGGKSKIKRTSADNRWMIISTSAYLVAAFYDDTKIFANGELVDTVNKQQIKSINFSANDIIYSNKPISFSRSGSGQTGICYAFQGTQFAHRFDRYTNSIYIVATEKDASVTITRGASTSYWSGTVSTTSYTTVSTSTTYGQFIIESDNKIAVYVGDLPTSDCMPLYPCSLELFGTASSNGHILAIEDNTTIYEYSTSGSSRSFTLNRGGWGGFSYTGGSQFAGDSVRLVADKPIAAESQADADGGEMTPFISKDGFGTQFVIPENEREFVKIVSDVPATVEAYDASDNLLSTTTLTGSSANKVYNARLTGTSSYEGVLIKSDLPVTAIYEGEDDDETILFAHQPEDVRVEYGPKIVTDGLVFHVDFANPKCYSGSGTTVQNLVPNGSNGEFIDSPTYSSNNNGYLSFVTNDGIRFPEDNTLDIQTPTVSVWVRPNIIDQNGFWFEKGTVNTQYSLFQSVNGSGYIHWRQRIDGVLTDLVITDGPSYLSTTSFNNIVGTYESGSRKIFINGVKVEEDTKSGIIDTTDGGMSIGVYGGYSGSRNYWYDGDIGVVSVYNKQLSDEEVKQNFNALRGRYGI